MASTKLWVRWLSTLAAIVLFGAMLYVGLARGASNLGFVFLGLIVVCSLLYKWATRP